MQLMMSKKMKDGRMKIKMKMKTKTKMKTEMKTKMRIENYYYND